MKSFIEWLTDAPEIKIFDTSNSIEVSYLEPEVRGYLHAKRDDKNPNIFRVIRVTVEPQGKGYGKKLYLAALKAAAKKGVLLAPAKNSTSDSAFNIWKSFYMSSNVEKIPLSASDWPDSPRNQNMMKKYPSLRYSDPFTYPPKSDVEFWAFNSGYKI